MHIQTKFKKKLSSEELFALLALALDRLPDFKLLTGANGSIESGNSGEFSMKGSLQKFALTPGIHLTNVEYISGKFLFQNDPVSELARLIEKSEISFKELASMQALCNFKVQGFDQAKVPDQTGIYLLNGKRLFVYESRIEPALARKGRLAQVITDAGLPITITEDSRGFYLKHISVEKLRLLSAGVFKENTFGFWCEIESTEAAQLLPLLRAALSRASSVSGGSWTIIADEDKHLGFDVVLAQDFPCDSFDINFLYAIDNVKVLDSLHAVKMSKGFFSTEIAHFKIDGTDGWLEVRTNPRGHHLYAHLEEESLPELNEYLGVKLVNDE
jgi:hypothetical protein